MGRDDDNTKNKTVDIADGERYLPGMATQIELEHMHRYKVATDYCEGKRVLDVACGEGYGSYLLSEVASEVVGVDIDRPTVINAAEKYLKENLGFTAGDCTDLPSATALSTS